MWLPFALPLQERLLRKLLRLAHTLIGTLFQADDPEPERYLQVQGTRSQ
jgi:hypothetical protein